MFLLENVSDNINLLFLLSNRDIQCVFNHSVRKGGTEATGA